MKHADAAALVRLEPLLKEIRKREKLKEKTRGNFYRGGRAFLHFHVHGEAEFYADIRAEGDDFERLAVSTAAQQKFLVLMIDKALADRTARSRR